MSVKDHYEWPDLGAGHDLAGTESSATNMNHLS